MSPQILNLALLARRMDDARGGGGFGLFVVLMIAGIILFLVLKGRRDRAERIGEPIRPMASGPLQGQTFACPFPKCPSCGAAGDKMKQDWDGLRKVTWTCGYCGSAAVQELKDEELPPGARRRLGLDQEPDAAQLGPGAQGYYPQQGGSGMGGLLTGMMIGSMMGGGHRQPDQDGWVQGGDGGSSASSNDWGEGGGSGGDWGDSGGSGGDWGDSGGGGDWGDSGGGDNF